MKIISGKPAGHILACGTIIVWGTTFIASKVLLKEFTTLQVMAIRFAIAYLTLLLLNHNRQKVKWREELLFFFLAVTGTTVYFLFENQALVVTYASNVSILLSVAPILTAILAHFFTKDEKMHGMIFLGSFIAFAGVVLVVFNGTVVLQLRPLGDVLSFGAALSWAVYSVALKNHVHQFDPIFLTRKVLFYSIVTTIPLLIVEHKPFPFLELGKPPVLGSFLFLGVLGSGICYVTWNIAATRLGIVTTNNYIYLSPFVTMGAADLMLHEKITFIGVIGALLIIAGVVFADRQKPGTVKIRKSADLLNEDPKCADGLECGIPTKANAGE